MKTILQVDDDANDVFLLRHAMRKAGITNPVQVVGDGQGAIDYLKGAGKFADRERFPFPSLLLMDLKLPYVMGLDVLRWIRVQPRMSLMVIVLTASAEDADIAEAYRLGANAFLTKPSEASKLEDMVKAIKAFWLTHNTLPSEPSSDPVRHRPFTLTLCREQSRTAKSLFQEDDLSDHPRNGHVVAPLLVESSSRQPQPQTPSALDPGGPALTKRQAEVLRLIAEGCSSRNIALQLSISIKTVEKHRQSLMDRLDIHEVAGLTRYAVSRGLVSSTLAHGNGSERSPTWHGREVVGSLQPGADRTS